MPQSSSNKPVVRLFRGHYWVHYEDQKKLKKKIKFVHAAAAHEFALAIQEAIIPRDIKITESEIDS